jgi:hypothetical protein
MRKGGLLWVIEESTGCFLLNFGGAEIREKNKGCYCGREKEIETNCHRIPAK